MINKNVAIGISILIIVILGFTFFSNVTGHAITSSSINNEKISNEYFRISESGEQLNKEDNLNDTQNKSGSR
ncbi:MAG: hypothetical protein OEL87_00915 [Nanoarchaeota archaeon]|nr:hypothetical protein [Nanoarchaeota archaeon]